MCGGRRLSLHGHGAFRTCAPWCALIFFPCSVDRYHCRAYQNRPTLKITVPVPVCKRKNSRRTKARMFEKRRCGREVRDGDHRALSLSFSLYFSISFPPLSCVVCGIYPYDVTHPGPRSTATRHSYRHDHDCPPCPGKCKFSQSQDAYRSGRRLCSWNQAP